MIASVLRKIRKQLRTGVFRSLSLRQRRRLAWQLMLETGVHSFTFGRNGLVWNVRPDDDVGWVLFVEGGYHAAEIQALLAWMRGSNVLSGSRNVLVDAGANIGTTCIPIVRETGCRALAIEPVAENFHRLRQNVDANGLGDRILLARKAVARQPATLRMRLTPGVSGGHFVAQGDEDGIADGMPRYEDVEADTLAGIIAAAGLSAREIAFVWADVQGCEPEVIESGSMLWAHGVPLWAEVEPGSLRRQGTLEAFAGIVAAHFDLFIDSRDLIRLGAHALPRPVREFRGLIDAITPEQINTDVLLLPPAPESGRAGS